MRAHALARRNAAFVMPEASGLAGAVSVAGELTYLLGVRRSISFRMTTSSLHLVLSQKEDRHDEGDLRQILRHHRYGLDRGAPKPTLPTDSD